MKIETLKKSHLKRNIIIGIIIVLLISAVMLNFTRAKYKTTQSIPLVNGTINYSLADFNAVAIYVNGDSGYTKADTIPDGYVLNESESYCTINGEKDINISLKNGIFTLKMGDSGFGRTERSCHIDCTDSVRIFSDTSSVEIFVNGEVFSSRVYEENTEKFSIILNSSSELCNLTYYTLRSFEITKIS